MYVHRGCARTNLTWSIIRIRSRTRVYIDIYILVYYGIIVVVRVTKRPLIFLYFVFIFTRHGTRLARGWLASSVSPRKSLARGGSLLSLFSPGLQRPDSFLTAAHFVYIYIYDSALNELHTHTHTHTHSYLYVTGKSCPRRTRVREDAKRRTDRRRRRRF